MLRIAAVIETTPEQDFARFRAQGDVQALARVFDALAPQLLLVATHLMGGAVAEDLVQATFLDAIARKQRWDGVRPLGPWLCGLLSNHVHRERRRRQQVPDARRLAGGEMPSPPELAAAGEVVEAVRAAVERLPRQYHQVVTLRYLHGFELQQIAHTLRLPLGTVKTRLYRGMAMMKRALPAGLATAFAAVLTPGRGLAAVREVVLGCAGAATGVATAVTAAAVATSAAMVGAVAMQKLVLVVAVVVLALGGWFAVEAMRPGPVVPPGNGGGAAQLVRADVAAASPADAPGAEPAATATLQRERAATTGALEVQVNWKSDGTPAADAQVVWTRRQGGDRSGAVRLDARGRVAFAELVPGDYRVQESVTVGGQADFGFTAAVLTAVSAPTGGPTYQPPSVDVTVLPGQVASCTLVLDSDQRLLLRAVDAQGVAQRDAEIWGIECRSALASRPVGRTDGSGVVGYHGVPLQAVWARKTGLQPSRAARLPWASYPTPLLLVLGAAGCRLQGVVVDPSGRPAAAAKVAIADDSLAAMKFPRTNMVIQVDADAEGRFCCDELPAGDLAVLALAEGFAPVRSRVQTAVGEPVVVTLTLRQGATVRGRVTRADGSACAGVGVQVHERSDAMYGFEEFRVLPSHSTGTDGNGRYELGVVLPGKNELVFFTPSPLSRVLDLQVGEGRTCDLVLAANDHIAGRVIDRAGQPQAGWKIAAMAVDAASWPPHEVLSDGDGHFVLGDLRGETYRVFAFDAAATGAAAQVPYAGCDGVRPGTDDLVLRLDESAGRGGFLDGRVVWPATRSGGGLDLVLTPRSPGPRVAVMHAQHLEPGTATFEIGPLPAGDYDLLGDAEGCERIVRAGLHLVAGLRLPVAPLRLDEQQSFLLQFTTQDGKPATGAVVKVQTAGGLHACAEDVPGRFRSPRVSPGPHEVQVYGANLAPCRLQVEVGSDPSTPIERTVVACAATTLRCFPPAPVRQRLLTGMRVTIEDATGRELLTDFVQVDGTDHFDWSIGLLPGSYTVKAVMMGEGVATVALVVPAASPVDNVVEVRIARTH